MTTTLSASLGHSPLWTQAGAGSSPGYDAIDRRRADGMGFQEGVFGASSCEVVQRAAGATMSVDITTNVADGLGSGLMALVQGDAVSHQGLYPIPPHTAVINETITTAHATLPRVDQVVLEVLDNTHDSSGSNLVRTRVVAGTATSGATLDNRTGAAALPSSALLLADVLVGAAASSITNATIRDRRKWARGAYCMISRASADYSLTGIAGMTTVDGTNLAPRIECSGAPVRVRLMGTWTTTTSNVQLWIAPQIDGVGIDGLASAGGAGSMGSTLGGKAGTASGLWGGPLGVEWVCTPTVGSHVFSMAWDANGDVKLLANSNHPLLFEVQEIVRQNTRNNATTTG